MESLSDILSGADAPDSDASASSAAAESSATAETTKDEKPAAAGKTGASAASATSAEQATKGKTSEDDSEGETEGRTRDVSGRFAPKKADEAATATTDTKDGEAAPEKSDEVKALKQALKEERRKRQALERNKGEATAKDEKTAKDDADFWADPEKAIDKAVTEREAKIRRDSDARYFNLCERLAKAKHTDYDNVVAELIEETDENPQLARQVFAEAKASDDPAEFLYTYAANRKEMKSYGGDLGKYKTSIEEPLNAKIKTLEDENKALKDKLEKLGKIPSSLNAAPSATRAAVESEAVEDESLEAITTSRKRRA